MARIDRMTNREVQKKYTDAKKQLHICQTIEYKTQKHIMNYWYGKLVKRGIIL